METFAAKLWERWRKRKGESPQPENYTSSFIRRARKGTGVRTRVSRADGPGFGAASQQSQQLRVRTSERRWTLRGKETGTEKELPSYTKAEIIYQLHAETLGERDPEVFSVYKEWWVEVKYTEPIATDWRWIRCCAFFSVFALVFCFGEYKNVWGFSGGAVVENLPANAGHTGSSPGLGGSHMPRSN